MLALDIGTEFVKALVVQLDGTKGRILGVGKSRQNPGDMQNGAVTDIAAVISNCKEAIAEAERMSGVMPEQLVIGIAGELVKGATRTIRYRRHEPHAKIHFEELKNIIHKVQWKAFEQIRSELAFETGYNENDVKLESAAIVDVKVDNYKVANPIGFQGKEVIMTVFNAFSPLVHYGALQTIAAELDIPLLAITSEPYAVSRCMLSPKEGEHLNAIFVDIGGGTTDIAIVHDNTLERAAELKTVLAESISRLKPPGEAAFGTTDEWRFYNALYFPYIAGLRPYSRRGFKENLDDDQVAALQWFQSTVPERTLYNWQNAASKLVAQDLRERSIPD